MSDPRFRLPRQPMAYAQVPLATVSLSERPIQFALGASIVLHVLLIVLFTFRNLDLDPPAVSELEVVLVNSKSKEKPVDPLRRAQTNLNGGGNTDEDRMMSTPLAAVNDELAAQASEAEQRVARLEGEARQLMDRIRSEQEMRQQIQGTFSNDASDGTAKVPNPATDNTAQGSRGINANSAGAAFAREAAEIAKNYEAYQKRPRRKEIGGRTVEDVFARYEDDYRNKVEQIGTDHYPQPHDGKPVYGRVRLTVSIKSDGSIEKIVVNKSSGDAYLDKAAKSIVAQAKSFGPFTPDMLKKADVLDITRTFTFTRLEDGMHTTE